MEPPLPSYHREDREDQRTALLSSVKRLKAILSMGWGLGGTGSGVTRKSLQYPKAEPLVQDMNRPILWTITLFMSVINHESK